jgi:hypothetical protein
MIRKVRMRAAMNVKRKLAKTRRTRWRDEGNVGDQDGVAVIERTGVSAAQDASRSDGSREVQVGLRA